MCALAEKAFLLNEYLKCSFVVKKNITLKALSFSTKEESKE